MLQTIMICSLSLLEMNGFKGVVMTDWNTTGKGGSSPVECMKAGNDLIMPGSFDDIDILRNVLCDKGNEKLELKEVKKCVAHLANIILQTNEYKDSTSYLDQFGELEPYIESKII